MTKYNFENLRNDYMTPPELVELALKIKDVEYFVLDVCCSKKNIPALYHYIDGEKDGLTCPWEILNWCNPPFDECNKWVKKAYEEQKKGNETVMLIPVRTETKYWHDYILFNKNVEIHWLKKGTRFINPQNNQPMGIFKNALALVFFNNGENKC
ncbi:adenine methyltransferase [bacterium]|nr:adenine methyltransferase [bacterium]